MIKPDQIPDEVVKRFATWQFPKCTNSLMRSMLADALNAWPGAKPAWFLPQGKVYMLPAPWENKKWENSDG